MITTQCRWSVYKGAQSWELQDAFLPQSVTSGLAAVSHVVSVSTNTTHSALPPILGSCPTGSPWSQNIINNLFPHWKLTGRCAGDSCDISLRQRRAALRHVTEPILARSKDRSRSQSDTRRWQGHPAATGTLPCPGNTERWARRPNLRPTNTKYFISDQWTHKSEIGRD